jgi:hypothetical protein
MYMASRKVKFKMSELSLAAVFKNFEIFDIVFKT